MKWKTLPVDQITWDDVNHLLNHYPQLDLEDKVQFKGEGIIMIREMGAARKSVKIRILKRGHVRRRLLGNSTNDLTPSLASRNDDEAKKNSIG